MTTYNHTEPAKDSRYYIFAHNPDGKIYYFGSMRWVESLSDAVLFCKETGATSTYNATKSTHRHLDGYTVVIGKVDLVTDGFYPMPVLEVVK